MVNASDPLRFFKGISRPRWSRVSTRVVAKHAYRSSVDIFFKLNLSSGCCCFESVLTKSSQCKISLMLHVRAGRLVGPVYVSFLYPLHDSFYHSNVFSKILAPPGYAHEEHSAHVRLKVLQ